VQYLSDRWIGSGGPLDFPSIPNQGYMNIVIISRIGRGKKVALIDPTWFRLMITLLSVFD
jgi:hypothetical protein